MIVCQRVLRTFSAFRCSHYPKPAHGNLEKYGSSCRKWNFFDVSQRNMSIYGDNQSSRPADVDFPLCNDLYLLGDLDRFLLSYRDALYQNTEDITVKKLKECQLASDVLKIIDQVESPTVEQLVQAILTLRGFQKFLENNQEITASDFLSKYHDFQAVLKSSSFTKLVESILGRTSQLNSEELSCCILYLHRLGVHKETLKILVNVFQNSLRNSEESDITESALARLCIVLRDFNDLYGFHILNDILPILFRKLDLCSDFETLGKITVCFQKMVPILGVGPLKKLIEKSRVVLQKSEDQDIECNRARTVLKILLLLSFKTWQGQFSWYEKELLKSLSGSLKCLSVVEMAVLYDVALENMECDPLVNEINQTVDDLLSNSTSQNDFRKLYVLSLFPKMKRSDQLTEKMLQFYSEKPLSPNELYADINNFYYWLLTADNALLKESSKVFWDRVLNYLDSIPSLVSVDKLMWISLRYLNYHQSRHFYCKRFEKQMYEYLMPIVYGDKNSILAPKDYVRICLIIAFFQPYGNHFSNSVCDRIVDNISRLGFYENMSASFVLKMMLKRLQKTEKFSKFLPHYMNMLAALNNNSLEHLSYCDSNFEVLNGILKAFQYRELVKTSPLFDLICNRLKEVPLECMNAKYIRDCILNLSDCSHLEPQLTDTMIAHVIAEKENLQLSLFNILLNHLFWFGYTPKRCDEFVDALKKMTLKNKNNLPANVIIRTALALCYYHDLPIEFTDYIFNVEFFNKLDQEIQTSTNKHLVKYIRQNLMELNRSVCLEYPERDIPWFHEKYCQEINALERRRDDYFFDDVSQKLGEIIPMKNSVRLHCYSPYYHKIDFLIHTNRKGEPVDPDSCAPSHLRKIAVLLAREISPSTYYKRKGKHEMLIRELELLDYKVIVVDRKIWNSMYMSEPFAKENYLCSLIWPR